MASRSVERRGAMSEREQRRVVLAKRLIIRGNELKGGRVRDQGTSRSLELSAAEGETATTATLTDHRGSQMIEEVEGESERGVYERESI